MQRMASAGKLGGLAVAVATLALGAGIALAAPGDHAPSYSGDGRATVNFGGNDTIYYAADVAMTPDGGSVMAGTTRADFGQPLQIAVAKLRSDGSLDPSFSGDGKVIIPRGISAYAYAVAVQPDGKVVVAGTHDEGGGEFFDIVRINANGTLDSSFAAGGFRSISFNTPLEEAYDVMVAPDGKILATGYAGEYHPQTQMTPAFADYDLVVVRLNSNGAPDTTFSGDGVAKPLSTNSDTANAVALQADGKILVAGLKNDEMTVTRFNDDGTVDGGYGTGGQATLDFPNTTDSAANAIAVQPDGNAMLAGYIRRAPGNTDLAIARIDPNGALDPNFSDDGKVVSDFGGTDEQANSVAVQTNGKVVVGGYGGDSSDLIGLRFDANGVPDSGFGGGDGVVTVEFASDSDYGGDVAIQPDGPILLSGVTGNNDDFAIARLLGDPTGIAPPPPPTDSDVTPPETTITKEPDSKSHKSKAKYRFESSESGSSFECAFDSKTYKPCDAGKVKYKRLDFGKHKFSVRATDAAGNTDPSPDKDKFKRKR